MVFLKGGQVWVESVLYTLIILSIIGVLLAFVRPKIEESRDRIIIEQSIKVLEEIDQVIENIGGPGNQRIMIIKVGKGSLNIDSEQDIIYFRMETKSPYSEYGEEVNIGKIMVVTRKIGSNNEVTLISNYSRGYNLLYKNSDEVGRITKSSNPYKIFISNINETQSKKNINIEAII
ncbi:MAG: hypothetical protein QXU40_00630 [Candidatus Pacearchaeota archaeon]